MSAYVRRAAIAGLVAALTFAGLWWASAALGWFRHDRPVGRVLASRPDLVSYELGWSGDTLLVEVLPVPGVDLPAFYESLHRQVASALGTRDFVLLVRDRRDPLLRETMRSVRLFLEEAMVNGRFSWADRMLTDLARARGLEWARLSVDTGHVFVELRHGPAYLYEVIPRPGLAGTGAAR